MSLGGGEMAAKDWDGDGNTPKHRGYRDLGNGRQLDDENNRDSLCLLKRVKWNAEGREKSCSRS